MSKPDEQKHKSSTAEASSAANVRPKHAPCGCKWRSETITRTFRILFPTVWADCFCRIHKETWTERFEFDFSVPVGNITNEKAELLYKA